MSSSLAPAGPRPHREGAHARRAALLAAAVLGVAPAAAGAHAEVAATQPPEGALLGAPPARVVVDVTQPLGAVAAASVRGPDGEELAHPPRLAPRDARRVIVPLRPGVGSPGRYVASWAVTATDGHRLEGRVTFRVRAPAGGGAALADLGRRLAAAAAALRALSARIAAGG